MKQKTLVLAFSFLGMCTMKALSQNNETNQNGFKFKSMALEGGMFYSSAHELSLSDLKNYSAQSQIAQEMYSQKDSMIFGSFNYPTAIPYAGLSVQWKKVGQGRIDSRIILGFDALQMDLGSISAYRYQTGRYDTITSSATGKEEYVDTVNTKGYSMYQSAEMVGLRLGYQISTKFDSRWQFIAGINYSLRFSTHSQTQFNSFEYTYSSYAGSFHQTYGESGTYRMEKFQKEKPLMNSVSIPIGVDFTVGKKRPFFQNLHLQLSAESGFYAVSGMSSADIQRAYISFRGGVLFDFR